MATKPKIVIIILNFNGRNNTVECLTSLKHLRADNFDVQIWVVDNASTDKSIEAIKEKFPHIEIIANRTNLGFSAGNNIGIKKALDQSADYILLLNNDTIIEPTFLEELVKFSRVNPKVGIMGPALRFKKGFEVFYDLGGRVNTFFGRTTHQTVSLISNSLPHTVDYVSGACMLVKSEVFEKIGLLDEPYFFGFEDVEFCLEAKKNGYDVYNVPNSVVEHKVSSSIGHQSPTKIYYLLRNNLRFVFREILFPKNLLSYLYLLLLSIKMFVDTPRFFTPIMQAWFDFFSGNFGRRLS